MLCWEKGFYHTLINFFFIMSFLLLLLLLFVRFSFSIHVHGNQLVDQNGQIVRLRMVSRSGTEFACITGRGIFDGPVDDQAIDVMQTNGWHVNAVRVPLNDQCWFAQSVLCGALISPAGWALICCPTLRTLWVNRTVLPLGRL